MTEAKADVKNEIKADAKTFTIVSSDKRDVAFVHHGLVAMSKLIADAVKKDAGANSVEFGAKATTLTQIAEYVKHYASGEEKFDGTTVEAKLSKWDEDFCKRCRQSDPYLVDITTAADGLRMDMLIKKLTHNIAIHASETTSSVDADKLADYFEKLYLKQEAKKP